MKKLSQIVTGSGVQVYREIVPVALFSIVSSLVLLPFLFLLPVGPAVVFVLLLYVPLCAGVMHATHRILSGEKGKVRMMWKGALKFYPSALVFGALMALFMLILVSSWWYYGGKGGTLYFALAVFQTYFVGMALVSQVYTLPLIVQEGVGVFTAIGRSVKLFLANPLYTIGAFVQIVCLTIVLGITIVGFAFLFVGMISIYLNMLTANLIRKEDAENNDSDRIKVEDKWESELSVDRSGEGTLAPLR